MKRIFHWMLAGITVLGLIIRLDGMDEEGLWHDEAVCWRDVHATWPNFIDTLLEGECNPPLYFALLKVWTGLVGESVWALRMPPVAFGTLTIPLLGLLVSRLAGPGAACLAALFMAISPFHVGYSQEARPYAFFSFIVLASTVALAWALETRNMAGWAKGGKWLRSPFVLFALFGLLTLAAVSLDYSYAVYPLRALAATAVLFWAVERWKGKRSGQMEIYAVLAVLAYYARFNYYAHPLIVLVTSMLCLWVVETALAARQGGWRDGRSWAGAVRRDWRSWAFAVLGFIAFVSQYLALELPFIVLGAAAALYWALEIRKGGKPEGGKEIYAFVVVIAFFLIFDGDVEPSCILAATAPACWALEKWRQSRRQAGDNERKAATQTAADPALAPRTGAHPLPGPSRPWTASPLVRYSVYALLALLACYTHYFAAFFMVGHGAFVALVCWKERRLQPAWSWFLCMAAVGICYLPWLPYMLEFNLVRPSQWVSWVLRDWSAPMQFWFVIKSVVFGAGWPQWLGDVVFVKEHFFGADWPQWLGNVFSPDYGDAFPDAALVLAPLVIWLAYRSCFDTAQKTEESCPRPAATGQRSKTGEVNNHVLADSSQTCASAADRLARDAYAFAFFSVMTMVPLLAAWSVSQYRPSLVPRYVIPCVPPVMALLALTIWRFRWLALRIALAAVMGFYLYGEMYYQHSFTSRPGLNQAAAYIGAHLEPGDGIVVEPSEVHVVLRYYLRKRTPPLVNEYHYTDHPDPEERPLPKDLAEKLAPFKRVWLLREGMAPPYPIERYLDDHYEQVGRSQKFLGVGAVKVFVPRKGG